MIDENTNNQLENQLNHLQSQNPQPQINSTVPTQAEILEFIKFTRCTALATDRLVHSILQMSSKLEEEGILNSGRTSRLDRDKKLRSIKSKLQKSESEIDEMMKLIPNHPDADMMINSLFKGIKSFINNNTDGLNNPTPDNTSTNNEDNQQQKIDSNNEIEYFNSNTDDSIITYIIEFNQDLKNIIDEMKQVYKSNKLENYKFYEYCALPFLFIFSRNMRLPLPSNIIYQFI